MSEDTVDELPTIPSVSTYEYSAQCSPEVLHSPNIELLVQLLQDHPDYIGFQDKIALLAESGQD